MPTNIRLDLRQCVIADYNRKYIDNWKIMVSILLKDTYY